MASTADFRNGLVFLLDNNLMEIVEFQHVKPGKGGAFVRTKLRNVLTGRVIERTFRSGERVEDVRLEEQTYQFMYSDGDLYHFMHKVTYEQIPVGAALVGDKAKWMLENMEVGILFHDGKAIAVNMPNFSVYTITRCDPGVQGDRAQGGTKPATLESGATIQVPLFVGEGERVKVDTRSGTYIERA